MAGAQKDTSNKNMETSRKSLGGASAESERSVDRRQEILSAAARLFASEGVVSTTVRDIGRVAGILSGSLYHHFPSKESMVDEILSPCVRSLVAEDELILS